MPNVRLRSTDSGVYELLIDGHDVSDAVLREGFCLGIPEDGPATLAVCFSVDELDVDVEAEVDRG